MKQTECPGTKVDDVLRLNPLVRIRFDGDVRIDLPLQRREFRLDDVDLLAALPAIVDGGTVSESVSALLGADLADTELSAVHLIEQLISAELVTRSESVPDGWDAAQHWIDRGWLDALLFHAACETDYFVGDGADDPDDLHDELLRKDVSHGLPTVWTRYDQRPIIDLPTGRAFDDLPPLETVLLNRRSNQRWRSPSGPPFADIATVLRLASEETVAVRRRMEKDIGKHPSALLHSAYTALELYLVVHQVPGMDPGLYHYEPDMERLRQLRKGPLRKEMQRMCVGQRRAATAGALFVITATWDRYMRRYPQPSGYRTLMVNVGELAHKLVVLSTAVGLSTFITPALDDAYADSLFDMNPEIESPIEVIGVG
ncbi:MAG: SagB/ThcOx family dehydrogenase [Candidatus Dormibacteria bacterium]